MASKRYNDNDKNAVGLMSKKLALISHFFSYIFLLSQLNYDVKHPNSTFYIEEVRKRRQIFLSLFRLGCGR